MIVETLLAVVLMWVVLIWLAGSIFVAWVASEKGWGRGTWFAVSLLFTPILALVALAAVALADIPAGHERRFMPHWKWR